MSKTIKCPNCGKDIQLDESTYSDLLSQVKKAEVEKEIQNQLALANAKSSEELTALKANFETLLAKEKTKAVSDMADLKAALDKTKTELAAQEKVAKANKEAEMLKLSNEKDKELESFKAKIAELNLAIQSEKARAKDELENTIKAKDEQIRVRDEDIQRWKDYRHSQSVKVKGEDLEQYCQAEFNKIRSTAFPNAYFEKDNAVIEGGKADYLYIDKDEAGTEFISVIMDMKNENDDSAHKKKNEDYFKKLDDDRKKKGAEYAILVSVLEADSDLYNQGIVDVSYKYEKMYVVRPQMLIPLLTILRDANKKNLETKKQLIAYQGEHVDLVNFEANLDDFKTGFLKTFGFAQDNHNKAIDAIDKAIKSLEATKEALRTSDKHIAASINKLEEVTPRKLAKNSPSIKAKFEGK